MVQDECERTGPGTPIHCYNHIFFSSALYPQKCMLTRNKHRWDTFYISQKLIKIWLDPEAWVTETETHFQRKTEFTEQTPA